MRTRTGNVNGAVNGQVAGSGSTVINAYAQTVRKCHGYIAKDHIAASLEPYTITWVTGYSQVPYFYLRFSIALYRNDQQVIAVAVEGRANKIEDGVAGNVHGFYGAA